MKLELDGHIEIGTFSADVVGTQGGKCYRGKNECLLGSISRRLRRGY